MEVLRSLDILDSPPDPGLDALVKAASAVCGVPISLVSLVSSDRQWFKAAIGLEQGTGTPREHAFCAHTILEDDLFEVPDAREDERFVDNPLVTGDPNIRFYAAVPVRVAGLPMGTLCVIDHEPRSLDSHQREILESLAVAAGELIGVRYQDLAREQQQLTNVIEATDVAIWEYDVPSGGININERWAGLLGYSKQELEPVTLDTFWELIHTGDQHNVAEALEKHLQGEASSYECEIRMRHKDGRWIWLLTRGRVLEWDKDGGPLRMFGVHLDIQIRKAQHESLTHMSELLNTTGAMAKVGGWQLNLESQELIWTDETKRIHGVPLDYEPDVEAAISFYAPEGQDPIREAVDRATTTGEPWDLELPLIRADGETIWVHAQGCAIFEDEEPVLLYGAFQDITERRKLLLDVSEHREQLRVTLESIGDAVITTDASGKITWLNPIAETLTGWPSDLAQGLPLGDVFHAVYEHDRTPIAEPVSRCLEERRIVTLADDTVLVSRSGQEYGIEDSAAPILTEDDELLGAVMVFRDVTEQRRLTGEMRFRAKHDALTKLINRAEFEARLGVLLEEAREDGSEHAVLYVDLDQFKIVNDSCGHTVGDVLLQKLAIVFRDAVRARDTVARLGGDEFAIILERCPGDRALQIAEQVCERVRDFRFIHGEQRFRVGASIGLVQVSGAWTSVSAILQAADTSCYAAKDAGRDRVHVYESGDVAILNQRSETRWATLLEAALDEGRFVLFKQPIVPTGSGDGVCTQKRIELLLRMQQEDGELVPPGAFMPVAERFHLISRIDRWVIESALIALASPKHSETTFFLNLSGRSVGDRLFQDFVLAAIRRQDLSMRERLVFEITETAMISNLADAREFFQELRELGVGLALDDFGAGMSSFGYLNSLPISYLKLDGQFVGSMENDKLALAAIRAFIDVATTLEIPTIAEHVENEAELQTLRDMGVHYVQGYHIDVPAPFELT